MLLDIGPLPAARVSTPAPDRSHSFPSPALPAIDTAIRRHSNGATMDLETARRILQAHRHLFVRAYIHGSVARGTQDEHSDIDIVLIRDTTLPFFDRIRELFDLVFAFRKVDLLVYTEAEYRGIVEGPGRHFLKDVFEKGVRIEGAQVRGAQVAPAG